MHTYPLNFLEYFSTSSSFIPLTSLLSLFFSFSLFDVLDRIVSHDQVDRHAAVDKLDLYTEDVAAIFKKFQASTKEELSTEQVLEFLEANGQDLSGSDDTLLRRWLVDLCLNT